MTFTYLLPSSSPLGEVRLLIGDTDSTDVLLTDEEITYMLAEFPSALLASAAACDALAAKFSRQVSTSNLGLSVQANQRADAYRRRAVELRKRYSRLAASYAGGLTIAGNEALDVDTSLRQPAFKLGMDNMPGQETDLVSPLKTGS